MVRRNRSAAAVPGPAGAVPGEYVVLREIWKQEVTIRVHAQNVLPLQSQLCPLQVAPGASSHSAGVGVAPPSTAATWVLALDDRETLSARAFMVRRARRIWGRLDQLLSRSLWRQAYRALHFVPARVLKFVKWWRPRFWA